MSRSFKFILWFQLFLCVFSYYCKWSQWSYSQTCSWNQGSCQKMETRKCSNCRYKYGCPGNLYKKWTNCSNKSCPHVADYGEWKSWSSWDSSCPSYRKRSRQCISKPHLGFPEKNIYRCYFDDDEKDYRYCEYSHSLAVIIAPVVVFSTIIVVVVALLLRLYCIKRRVQNLARRNVHQQSPICVTSNSAFTSSSNGVHQSNSSQFSLLCGSAPSYDVVMSANNSHNAAPPSYDEVIAAGTGRIV